MNAINHAVTALVIKKYHRDVPLLPLLISVQLIEMVWVIRVWISQDFEGNRYRRFARQ